MDQTSIMINECDCSEREKRKRIAESLKGPALKIIQTVQDGYPTASPTDYLQALESIFGSSERGEDLYLCFRTSNV